MHRCTTCSREIRTLEAPVRREGPLTPEAYAMNALNRDRLDDLRHNTVHPAPVASALCIDCWAKTPEGIAWEKDKFGTPKTATTPVAEPPAAATPDYTKVGGWLMFFGVVAAMAFALHLLGFVMMHDRWIQLVRIPFAGDAEAYEIIRAIGLPLVPFIALGQCIFIFQKKRAGRTLSLMFYGGLVLSAVIDLLTMETRISADMKRDGAEYLSLAWPMYLGAFGSIVIHGLPFAFFLKSERVAKTLIN